MIGMKLSRIEARQPITDNGFMINDSYQTFPIFDQFDEITCAFSSRRGGFSEGAFRSLNMGNMKFDDPATIYRNRSLFLENLDINQTAVAFPGQIHSATVKIISKAGEIPKTDSLITLEKDLFLGILTADCFPVFIYNPRLQLVAAIHAGWRGVLQNIITKTLDLIMKQPAAHASDIYAAIGPGLQKECFEVRSDVYNYFPDEYLDSHPDSSKRYLDMSAYIMHQLESMNIPNEQIFNSRNCTKCNYRDYFSHRRDGEKTGRMLGIIGMRN